MSGLFRYYSTRYANCNCYIIEFDPRFVRFDTGFGTSKKLEKLSKMKTDAKTGEVTIARVNGGYFVGGTTKEFIGTFVDEGISHHISYQYYPNMIYDNFGLSVEYDPPASRLEYYRTTKDWVIGVPWTIVVNGKKDYHYNKSTLTKVFGHPFTRQPRTMIGQKADGNIIWAVADGRKTSSVGMTVDTCADFLISLGCVIGFNLDGGGSSEIICYDTIKNKPSDGGERSIGTAFFAYLNISDGVYGAVNTSSLNMRKGNSTSYGIITKLSNGTEVKIIGYNKGWYHVQYGNYTGWCSCNYINLTGKEPSKLIVPATPKIETVKEIVKSSEVSLDDLLKLGYKSIEL